MTEPSPGLETMDVTAAEAFVVELLSVKGPMTTMEIEQHARRKHKRCPDQTVIFLTKMKRKGLIRGEASLERRGWVWWVR